LLDHPIPIHAAIGDSHAALFAYGCHERGSCMTGYGTGSCVMMNLGITPTLSQNGLSTSVAWRSMGETHYLFDGVVNYSGAVITWLCSELGLAKSPAETAELALRAHPADQTYLVPAFTGLGAPHWSNRANAIFCGMTRLTSRAELVRAALECIAYQISDILLAMSQDAGIVPDAMRVSGGPTKNCYLMQFQSDILGYPVLIPENEEMTCLGAAYLAGQALGVYDNAFIANGPPSHAVYQPAMSEEVRREKLTGWQQAVCLALGTETRSGNED
ncbi:MAG: FGGY-family carbohydrate kinase, partial [Oscillospiraceae bacterium]